MGSDQSGQAGGASRFPAREHEVRCVSAAGIHRMAYREYGPRDAARTLLCVHGLTRNGHDFEPLAQRLAADGWRVVCPDVVGRGHSSWLADPRHYEFPQYVADMMLLLARLDLDSVSWLGTSMGGLIGMIIASLDDSPVERLILNDVGPFVPVEALRRIGEYVGQAPSFASVDEAERFLRFVCAPFGDLGDAGWRRLTETSIKPVADGRWNMRYDPRIAENFRAQAAGGDIDLWPIYERIRCPTLVIRGARSDLLGADTLAQMALRGPRAQTAEIAGVGHAPMFFDDAQIGLLRAFLAGR
ncbi:alpha/beta fold hydrolase [Rhodocyclus tenuis]|uniref:alpha/beta fold hydrolase n=1 Tax=Rhodocyclus tenuis TaxID=1066 RepID=UPI00190630B5|nr:alpha/beta hydrolase [Rhodocyclus tenuis]MBK1679153.1 alpha/beta hydrolase [Rhodocyclus tenuis]